MLYYCFKRFNNLTLKTQSILLYKVDCVLEFPVLRSVFEGPLFFPIIVFDIMLLIFLFRDLDHFKHGITHTNPAQLHRGAGSVKHKVGHLHLQKTSEMEKKQQTSKHCHALFVPTSQA